MTVTSVVTLDDWHRVHEGGAYVIVAYTAQWCEPSQRITDEFRRLSESRRNLHFISVDVEDAEDVSQLCGISAMPAFHIYKQGVFIESFVGDSKHQLRALADRYNAT